MKTSLLFTVLLFPLAAPAQTLRSSGNITYTHLAAYSTKFVDAFSVGGNTGALATAEKFSAGIYSERRFGLKELGAHAATVVVPTSSGNFALRGDYLGGTAYNESSVGLAYGRKLGDRLLLGMQFNYYALKATGYEAASSVNVDAGLLVRLTPELSAGVQACNPVQSAWSKEGIGRPPGVYRAGVGYDASQQFLLTAEAEKVEDKPLGINVGIQYLLAEKLLVRAGIHSATTVYFFGLGLRLKYLRFDVTASLHPYLGLSRGLLLLYAPAE